jgi:predicted nucleotide-binding protein
MTEDIAFKEIFPILKYQFKSLDMRGIFAFSHDEGFWRCAFLKLRFTKLETSELKKQQKLIIDKYKEVRLRDFQIKLEARKSDEAHAIFNDLQNLRVKMTDLDAKPLGTNYQNIDSNDSFVEDYRLYTNIIDIEENYPKKALISFSSHRPIDVIKYCKVNLSKYNIDLYNYIYYLGINDLNRNSDLLIILPIYCRYLENDSKKYIAKFELHNKLIHGSEAILTLNDENGTLLENSDTLDIETITKNKQNEMNIFYLPKFDTPIENSHKVSVHISRPDIGNLFKKTFTGSEINKEKSPKSTGDLLFRPMEITNKVKSPYDPKKIFIVHGHDKEAKLELKIMLRDFGLTPIILDERPDKGRTIIEKFEQEVSDIGYAFILLTPDDKITISTDNDETDQPNTKKLNRARQNVVFEMGFFMGKRGRERVCCIYKGVEKPSDIDGIVYKSYDNSVNDLYRSIRDELKSAGYQINEN